MQQTLRLADGSARFENRLDYTVFSETLCAAHACERFRTYVYDALPYQGDSPTVWERSLFAEKQKFKSYLDSQPCFLTRYGVCMRVPNRSCQLRDRHSRPPCEHITQKGVDVRFTIDLVSLAADKRIDTAILITGDSDFIPAIEYARDQNMKVILYYRYAPNERIFLHRGLQYACDEHYPLDAARFSGSAFQP